jgi:hypothetical protein
MGNPAINWGSTFDELVGAANNIKKIEDEGTNAIVADLGTSMNQTIKDMEAAQKSEIAPHQEKIDAIKDRYKEWIPPLKKAVSRLRGLVVDYKRKLEVERAEALKKEEEARKKDAEGQEPPTGIREAAPPPPKNVSTGAFGKSTVKKVWVAELVDMKKLAAAVAEGRIPEDVLLVQKQKLTALGRGGVKFDPESDGVKVYQKETTSFG